MAVAAINSQLAIVDGVREPDGLDRLIADTRVFRRDVIPGRGGQTTNRHDGADRELEREPVRPAWKEIRHKKSVRPRRSAAQTTSENFCETIKQVQRSRVNVRFARAKRTGHSINRERDGKRKFVAHLKSFIKKLHAGFVRETFEIDNVKT